MAQRESPNDQSFKYFDLSRVRRQCIVSVKMPFTGRPQGRMINTIEFGIIGLAVRRVRYDRMELL